MPINTQILLDTRPVGEASVANFKLLQRETPVLQNGQVLVRHHYLSLDPYMRGRMNAGKSYATPQPLGEVMVGGTAGEVVQSLNPKFAVGDQVVGMGGWQEYSVVDATQPGALRKVDTTHVPLSYYLGAVGMPGVTAWYGLVKIIAPVAGETVTVSAAFFIKNRGLGEGHGLGAVHQAAFGRELAACGLHEAGFHLDGDHAHVRIHTACRRGHGHIQQGHAGPAVGDFE